MVTILHEGPPAITDRQLQVIELIAAGYSNEEVAARLGISPRTAKAHSDVLRQKLGCARRRQIRARTARSPAAIPSHKASEQYHPLRGTDGTRACGPPGSQARRLSRTSWRERNARIGLRGAGCGARVRR